MIRSTLSRAARSLKTWPVLERVALPPSRFTAFLDRGVQRLPAPVRGALPLALRGAPPGLSAEVLNEVSSKLLGEAPTRIAYVHLTGWKSSWVYRVFLRGQSGQTASLVYKNAVYDLAQIPALEGLPVLPGPPEYLIYRGAFDEEGGWARYLPGVYFCRELEPGRHYQYLLEDLGSRYLARHGANVVLHIAARLPALHEAMRGAIPPLDAGRLLHYDAAFRRRFADYARLQLRRYGAASRSPLARQMEERWEEIEVLYLNTPLPNGEMIGPLHGDPNRSNVLFHTAGDETKFIDWEWAGVGLPHHDLACAIKGVAPAVEQQALRMFAGQDTRLTFEEHRHAYRWCKLERGLLDAAFLAVQQLDAPDQTRFDIEEALQRALDAAQQLR